MIRNVIDVPATTEYLGQSNAPDISTCAAQAQLDRFQNKQDLPTEFNGMVSPHDKNVVFTSLVSPKSREPAGDRKKKSQTLVDFNGIFSKFELANLIVQETSITGLFALSHTGSEIRATVKEIIGRKKLIVHEKLEKNAWMINSASEIKKLASIEHAMFKSVEYLRSTPVVPPRMTCERIKIPVFSYVLPAPTAGGLLVQVSPNDSKSFVVAILGGNIVHKNVDAFFDAETLYADGILCLG